MPNLGGVKLWKKLNSSGVQVGRDELYHDFDGQAREKASGNDGFQRVVPAVPKPGERAGDQAPQPGLGQ